ncbi:MAG: GNAT family N-acetyltransferase [Candidatus Hodarchaeota archaeon]
MIAIRVFEAKDAEMVSALIRKNLIEVNSKDYPKAVIQTLWKGYNADSLIANAERRDIFVAIDDNIIVATAAIEANIIRDVFVHPDYHGQGIGTKLMKHLENLARARGHGHIDLPSSITAYGFYQKLGYKKVREDDDDLYGKSIIVRIAL